MIQFQRRWLLRIAIPLVAALGLFVWAMERARNVVAIENQSGQTIPFLQISRGDETKRFDAIPPGKSVAATTTAGGPFTVEGRLADGTLLRSRFGEAEARADLVMLPGGQLSYRKRNE